MDDELSYLNEMYGSGQATDLSPLVPAMTQAVQGAGTTPPADSTSLADVFHALFVAPAGAPNSGSIAGDIVNYFLKPAATKTQYVIQQSAAKPSTSLFSNPFVWVAIIAVIGLGIWLIKRG